MFDGKSFTTAWPSGSRCRRAWIIPKRCRAPGNRVLCILTALEVRNVTKNVTFKGFQLLVMVFS